MRSLPCSVVFGEGAWDVSATTLSACDSVCGSSGGKGGRVGKKGVRVGKKGKQGEECGKKGEWRRGAECFLCHRHRQLFVGEPT